MYNDLTVALSNVNAFRSSPFLCVLCVVATTISYKQTTVIAYLGNHAV
jgi:hypothetical protein